MRSRARHLASIVSVCVLLVACGGGSGGGGRGQPPIAAFTATAYVGERPFDVTFDASGSTDPDGSIASYSWSFGDGATADQAIVGHRFEEPGPHRVILTVTDDRGNRRSTSAVVTAIQPGEDPLFGAQWHLKNTGQTAGVPDVDVNVEPVWQGCGDDSCRGEGVRIAIVDDGLEIMHPDLSANIVNGASYNYLDGSADPTPVNEDDAHGTLVAGLAAARDVNSEGGRGAAPRAELVGYNVLQNATTVNQADAMVRGRSTVGVSANSWGAPDRTGSLQPSNLNWRTAIDTGLAEGRGGRGIVYMWAAGNGDVAYVYNGTNYTSVVVDNSNYDGQANYYGVIAVGAVDHTGVKASYSEKGANLWVVAPGGDANCGSRTITTTDLTGDAGINPGFSDNDLNDPDYTRCMNGTSAATPLVAGVAALMLQANRGLSWRDVRAILARTARQNSDTGWQTNGAGYLVNHKYGFGLVDAHAAAERARTWTPLPPMSTFSVPNLESSPQAVNSPIPENATEVDNTIVVTDSGIDSIEWVDIEFTSDHTYAGDLEITLTSPAGTKSVLSEEHLLCRDDSIISIICKPATSTSEGTWQWRFGSARHLEESADGPWTLTVVDRAGMTKMGGVNGPEGTGRWISWRLVIRGH